MSDNFKHGHELAPEVGLGIVALTTGQHKRSFLKQLVSPI